MAHKQNTKTVNIKKIKNEQPNENTSKNLWPVFCRRRNTHIHDDVLGLRDGRSVN